MINLKAPKVKIEMVPHFHPDLSMSSPGYNTFRAVTDYNVKLIFFFNFLNILEMMEKFGKLHCISYIFCEQMWDWVVGR